MADTFPRSIDRTDIIGSIRNSGNGPPLLPLQAEAHPPIRRGRTGTAHQYMGFSEVKQLAYCISMLVRLFAASCSIMVEFAAQCTVG